MSKYYLLRLRQNANFVVDETKEFNTESAAIKYFTERHPALGLDADGYAKHEDRTYCVAQAAF